MKNVSILLLTPTGKDSSLAAIVLAKSGFAPITCKDFHELQQKYDENAGALMIAIEALTGKTSVWLRDLIAAQPPWSDIPVVLFLPEDYLGSEKIREFFGHTSNITFLQRPFSVFALRNIANVALRARQRQFEVRELLEQREAARKEAEDENRKKDYFLAMLAHELRNPLASFRHGLKILVMEEAEPSDKKRVSEILNIQMDHFVSLVNDLLDVARIRTGKFDLKREIVDLSRVATVACEGIRSMMSEKHQLFETPIDQSSVWVSADPVRIEEAILNLLNNASKYTPSGGTIRLLVSKEGEEASIRVEDTGQGIEEQFHQTIFDPFVQAEHSMQRRQGGLGLGLFLVREIVNLHEGRISVKSAGLNRGSEFEIRIPLSPSGATPVKKDVVFTERMRCRILLIEDQVLIGETMRTLLATSGHEVEWVESGEEAIARFRKKHFDAAIVDIGLPDMTGYDVARKMRSMKTHNAPILIAVSGYGRPEDKKTALENGFDAHFTKPVNENEIFSFIDSALKEKSTCHNDTLKSAPSRPI